MTVRLLREDSRQDRREDSRQDRRKRAFNTSTFEPCVQQFRSTREEDVSSVVECSSASYVTQDYSTNLPWSNSL